MINPEVKQNEEEREMIMENNTLNKTLYLEFLDKAAYIYEGKIQDSKNSILRSE